MNQDIEAEICRIITEQLGCAKTEVTLDAKMIEDLGADSLAMVELIMTIEESFGIDIPDDEIEIPYDELKTSETTTDITVRHLADLVARKIEELQERQIQPQPLAKT